MAPAKHDPTVRSYVRDLAETFLRSIPTSAEYQKQYGELSPALKSKTTKEISQIADRLAEKLLSHKEPWSLPPKTMSRLIRQSIDDN